MSKPTAKLTKHFSLRYFYLTDSQWLNKPRTTVHYLTDSQWLYKPRTTVHYLTESQWLYKPRMTVHYLNFSRAPVSIDSVSAGHRDPKKLEN
jgi:hypothetical protein